MEQTFKEYLYGVYIKVFKENKKEDFEEWFNNLSPKIIAEYADNYGLVQSCNGKISVRKERKERLEANIN